MESILQKLRKFSIVSADPEVLRHIEMTDCVKSNYSSLRVFSLVGAACVFLMFVLTFFNPVVSRHRVVYFCGTVASLLIFLTARPIYERRPEWIAEMVYAATAVFFLYGIALGIYTDPGMQSTTFFVMMIFVPTLFTIRPFKMSLFIALFDSFFLIMVSQVKQGAVRSADMTDGVVFGILAVISNYYLASIKYQRFLAGHQMYVLGNIDQLTLVKNRNAYENERQNYSDACKESLTCIFTDVNGLHELNNTKGHKAGDEMLQQIARILVNTFGKDAVYRIGGDEFVVFLCDVPAGAVLDQIKSVRTAITQRGYSCSCGVCTQAKSDLNMEGITITAEQRMYQDKAAFYATHPVSNRVRSY